MVCQPRNESTIRDMDSFLGSVSRWNLHIFRDNIQEELKVELDALLRILSDVDLLNNAYDILV